MTTAEKRTIDLKVPVTIPLRVKDAAAALEKMIAASADAPERLEQLRAVSGLDEEMQQKWLLAHMLPGRSEPGRNTGAAGCVIVIAVVLVVIGRELVQWYNAHTQQTEEREEPVYEEREVEREVCPDKK